MTPDGKTFDPETVTDKQLVQYEQAIDRGLTEADALRLAEHEYNGFQANAIIAAALNPAVGEDVLYALATPKYTAAQMTAIAKIAIRGGDFARFLDPQMDARRMEAAYLVVAHGGSDLPVGRLSRSQLLTINNILLQGHVPYETVRAIAKPAFTPESMEVIAAAMENACHDPYTGENSMTKAQVARIMNPDYKPGQQIALLTAMRGQSPVADLSDADFAELFPASLSAEQMSACAYAVNRCGYNAPLLMMTMQLADRKWRFLDHAGVRRDERATAHVRLRCDSGRAFRCQYGKGFHNPYVHPSPYVPADALSAGGSQGRHSAFGSGIHEGASAGTGGTREGTSYRNRCQVRIP